MGQHWRAVIQPMGCNLQHQPNLFNSNRKATEGKRGESNYEVVFLVFGLLVRSLSSSAHAEQGKQPGDMQQMNNSILRLAFIHNWNILPTFQFHL